MLIAFVGNIVGPIHRKIQQTKQVSKIFYLINSHGKSKQDPSCLHASKTDYKLSIVSL